MSSLWTVPIIDWFPISPHEFSVPMNAQLCAWIPSHSHGFSHSFLMFSSSAGRSAEIGQLCLNWCKLLRCPVGVIVLRVPGFVGGASQMIWPMAIFWGYHSYTGWWFGTCYFFSGVQTTNQYMYVYAEVMLRWPYGGWRGAKPRSFPPMARMDDFFRYFLCG